MTDWGLKDWVLLLGALVSLGGLFSQLVINLAMGKRDREEFAAFKRTSDEAQNELRRDIGETRRDLAELRGRVEGRD